MSGNSNQDKLAYYQNLINQYQSAYDHAHRLSIRVGWIRFTVFLLFLFGIYQFLVVPYKLPFGIAILLLTILFGYLIKRHQRIKWRKSLNQKLLEINQNEYDHLQGLPSRFGDGEGWEANHRYAEDLDIFGPGSLFHYLNRCGTLSGRTHLALQLKEPYLNTQRITKAQQAVQELSDQPELRQNLFAYALLEKKLLTPEAMTISFEGRSTLTFASKIWTYLFFIWPIIMVGLSAYFVYSFDAYPVSIAMILALLFVGYFAKETQKNANVVSGKSKIWNRYATLFDLIDEQSFTGEELSEIQQSMHQAAEATRRLGKIGGRYDSRLNLLMVFLLNVYFLWDLQINRQLDRWLKAYEHRLRDWIATLGHFEAMASLSTFHFNHPDYTFPSFTERLTFRAVDLGHPLISSNTRVSNDCQFGPEHNLFIITGSNMAGKSTFLRTLGINAILAQIGAPICAQKLEMRPLYIQSSIRLSDNLQEETSFFYAELKKLQLILDDLQKGIPTLILLDEVLKGTNSEDKVYGAEQLIKKLIQFDALTFLATHILSLGKLSDEYPDRIVNFCFESTIDNDELHFDYRLKQGIAQHKNATFLMKKMGIIDSNID